ncbi:MAG: hypothetical protein P1U89_09545 [Verrucomicrobiales bacterium]|nr:hypothetical protein [Verrucomicrobiales bacterium]
MMIRYFLILICFLCPVFSRADEPAIDEIRKKYNEIEALKLDSVSVKFELEDDPLSGKIVIFSDGPHVKKVVYESGAEHGGTTESYYYSNGDLFFVFKQDSHWRFSGNTRADGQSETVDGLKELRFYYKDGKCIRALTRETESPNADVLNEKIAKLPNLTLDDADLAERIFGKGSTFYGLKWIF